MMERAIVTGATGFLGRWLVKELLGEGIPTVAVVRPNSKNLHFLTEDANLTIVECPFVSYASLGETIKKREHTVFFHLAWAGVSGSDRTNMSVQLENIQASNDAVIAAKELECTSFVGLGSIMELESIGAANTDGVCPGLGYIYGEAKHFAHLSTKALAAQLQIAHIWPVLTNAYGEYDFSPRFINTTLRKMLRGETLEFTSGVQMYDFIHVQDAAKALIAIGQCGQAYHSYVIGSGKAAPLRTFIESMGRLLAPGQELQFGNVPYTGAMLEKEAFSVQHLQEDTGFFPAISFEEGLRRTMDWMKSLREYPNE